MRDVYSSPQQRRDYRRMTLAAYRAFDRDYPGEWIDNADVFEAIASELDLDVCEEIEIDGKKYNAAEYRFRWTQQWLKIRGFVVRDDSGRATGKWKIKLFSNLERVR